VAGRIQPIRIRARRSRKLSSLPRLLHAIEFARAFGSIRHESVIRDYKSGRVRSIILIGHSLGGDAVLDVAEQLRNAGVPVALLISLDTGSIGPVASNVRRAVNFYISGSGVPVRPGPGFHGSLQNIDVKGVRGMDHMAIQSMPSMHSRMIGYVSGARGG
jgi:hypothetical protein